MIPFLFDDLKPRLIASLLFILILFGAFYSANIDGLRLFFPSIVSFITIGAIWEYLQMARSKGLHPPFWLIAAGTIGYNFAIFAQATQENATLLPHIALALIFASLFLWYFYKGKNPLLNLSVSIFALAYLALPLATATEIVFLNEGGRFALLFVLAVTKVGDIAAYFFGKSYGKHRLTPYISPKKTWEGAAAAIIASVATGLIFFAINKHFAFNFKLGLITTLLLSILISLFALFGDLAESLLKRDSGLKDSSQIPGIGGILDAVDSLVFTLPIMYIFLTMGV